MSVVELAYADGQLEALSRHKLAWPAATHPVVQESALNQSQPTAKQPPIPPAPATPDTVKQTFNLHEQGGTRVEPRRKLSEEMCTTCRKPRHYGSCRNPRPIPGPKTADFNAGLTADDATDGGPSMSAHYHAATTGDSSMARARDGRPADEQAGSLFADLYRHLGVTSTSDEPGRQTGGLNKVSVARKLADFMLPGAETHSMHEQRGPGLTPNPYEERLQLKSPPLGWGDEGPQRIERAFDQIDGAVDTTSVENSAPDPGPIA